MSDFDWAAIDDLYARGLAEGRQGVVGALVLNPLGQVFAQRRNLTRKLFPGCWDLVGGHIEADETPKQALEREVFEETGWHVARILGLRRVVDWEAPRHDGQPQRRREFVFAVLAEGDWQHPRLEVTNVTEGRWFSATELEGLNEGRPNTDSYVYDLVCAELSET
jgi:8-oxo-dGTP pyrophosphatase MutT (NUDIX family)